MPDQRKSSGGEVPRCESAEAAQPAPVVLAKELMRGARRVWIEHAAERYLLQITRSGKLILTK